MGDLEAAHREERGMSGRPNARDVLAAALTDHVDLGHPESAVYVANGILDDLAAAGLVVIPRPVDGPLAEDEQW